MIPLRSLQLVPLVSRVFASSSTPIDNTSRIPEHSMGAQDGNVNNIFGRFRNTNDRGEFVPVGSTQYDHQDLPEAPPSVQARRRMISLVVLGGITSLALAFKFRYPSFFSEESLLRIETVPIPSVMKITTLEKRAADGSPNAHLVLARLYFRGDLVDQDLQLSQYYLDQYAKLKPEADLPDFRAELESSRRIVKDY